MKDGEPLLRPWGTARGDVQAEGTHGEDAGKNGKDREIRKENGLEKEEGKEEEVKNGEKEGAGKNEGVGKKVEDGREKGATLSRIDSDMIMQVPGTIAYRALPYILSF